MLGAIQKWYTVKILSFLSFSGFAFFKVEKAVPAPESLGFALQLECPHNRSPRVVSP